MKLMAALPGFLNKKNKQVYNVSDIYYVPLEVKKRIVNDV